MAEQRKIIQVAVEPGWSYDKNMGRTRMVNLGGVVALYNDGTLWRLQYGEPGERVEWSEFAPIPQPKQEG